MEDRELMERCERVWSEEPVFFISLNARELPGPLASRAVVDLFIQEWEVGRKRHGWCVGRYLVLPGEVHFFCAADISARPLSQWLQIWKEWTGKRVGRELGMEGLRWEPGGSKELLDSEESYSRQLNAVMQAPVRAALVAQGQDWPWWGFVQSL